MEVGTIIHTKCMILSGFFRCRLLDLACRFEPPSPLTRWDTPLFRVCPIGDTSAFEPVDAQSEALFLGLNKNSTTEVEVYKEIPFDAIWESLTVTKTQAKHVAINPPVFIDERDHI